MKCTTYEQLHLEMARVYKTCEGTAFEGKEHLCVKLDGIICLMLPVFTGEPSRYEFFLGIVEDRAVWVDDIMYAQGIPVRVVQGISLGRFVLADGSRIDAEHLSFNPPAPPKPKTVSISVNEGKPVAWRWRHCNEGIWNFCLVNPTHLSFPIEKEPLYANKEAIELVLPDGDKDDFYLSELGSHDYWRTSGDATKFYAFVRNLLEGKL